MQNQKNNRVHIRKAVKEDWCFLWPLLHKMGKNDSEKGVRSRFYTMIDLQEQFIPIAINSKRVVGYAWAQDYGFHLRSGKKIIRMNDLYTDPDYRNLGVGKSLLDAIRQWSIQREASWLQWNSSPKAVDFYKRIGLEPLLEEEDYPFFEIEFESQD